MDIRSIPLRNIQDNIRRYRERGVTTGGRYTLFELLQEEKRRSPSPFPVVEVAQVIVSQSRSSADGLTSYKNLWRHFTGLPWQGNYAQRKVGAALGQVIAYCARHKLPVITTLVVKSDSRKLAVTAINAIYHEAREYGFDVGIHPDQFVQEQQQLARALVLTQFNPEEDDSDLTSR